MNSELASKFDVSGYPTLKFFRAGKPTEYGGGRTETEIVNWIRKKSGPAAKTISTADEAETFKTSAEVAVIGVFASETSAEAKVRPRIPWESCVCCDSPLRILGSCGVACVFSRIPSEFLAVLVAAV